ncbi:MAG: SUMF1/EgtB/PvdO family nonheme iron enzyme [Gammaproteobacteria bacterium]
MARLFIVSTPTDERRLGDGDLPLAVGRDPHCAVPLPGDPVPEDVRAWIAYSGAYAFIQPADDEQGLYHNRSRVEGSVWLKSGDLVQVAGALLEWQVQGDQVFLRVSKDSAAPAPVVPDLAAPSTPPPPQGDERSAATADSEPEPVADPVSTAYPGSGRGSPAPAPESLPVPTQAPMVQGAGWRKPLLGVIAALLVVAALFVLLVHPFEVEVTPSPDRLEVSGGLVPPVHIGGRLLAFAGDYRVRAAKAGYEDLDSPISVGPGPSNRFRLQMRELPGRVVVRVRPEVPFDVHDSHGDRLVTDASGVLELPAGEHQLRVVAQRHFAETVVLKVAGRGLRQELNVDLRPSWGALRVESSPGEARVQARVADKADKRLIDLGRTPLRAELDEGDYVLELALPRHKTTVLPVTISAGQTLQLPAQKLEPADGVAVLNSDPPGANVTVNGTFRGRTPITLELPSGRAHTLTFSKAGRESTKRTLTLEPEQRQAVSVALKPEFGVVFLSVRPADAELLIDGKPSGAANRRLRLPSRSHRLEIRREGYLPELLTVTPRKGPAQRIDIALKTPKQAAAAARAAAEKPRRTTADGQLLILVDPEGPFAMGAGRREQGRRANESQRTVRITRPYYLAETEVTNARFRAFKAGHQSGMSENLGLGRDDQPVVRVSWDDAARYCNWLSARDGLPAAYREVGGAMELLRPVNEGYRLPSEAEWAFAARNAGREAQARYPWGSGFPPTGKVGNWAGQEMADVFAITVPGYNDGHRASAPVGGFPSNPAGFRDLGGNVAEWTGDFYAVYPGAAGSEVSDPMGPPTGEHRVVRDSSWRHGSISELRLAYRDYSKAPRADLGFRVARFVHPAVSGR